MPESAPVPRGIYALDRNHAVMAMSEPFMKSTTAIQNSMPNTKGVGVALRGRCQLWLVTPKSYSPSMQEETR